jgi:iron complex outermembrane receptor protein
MRTLSLVLLSVSVSSSALAGSGGSLPDGSAEVSAELATVSGVVLAPDGTPLPGVTLSLARPDGSESRLAATGESGVFRLTGVAPGSWDLAATSPGFAPGLAELDNLQPGERRRVTITLPIATIREAVEVVGVAPRDSLEAAAIRESGARDVGEALSATAGVWKIRKGGIASDVVVRGLGQRDLSVLIDGQRVHGACPNRMDPPAFHVDFAEVDRVEVAKGPFDMRHPGSLGGVVNVVTRRPEPGLHFTPLLAGGSFGFVNPALTASWAGTRVSLLAGYSYRASEPFRDGSGKRFTETTNYRPDAYGRDAFEIGTGWARLGWRSGSVENPHQLQLSWTRQQADSVLYPFLNMDAVHDDTDRFNLLYETSGFPGTVKGLVARVSYSRVDHWMTDESRLSSAGTPRGWSMGTNAKTETSEARLEVRLQGASVGVEAGRRRWDASTAMAGMGYREQPTIPDVKTDTVGIFAEGSRHLGSHVLLTAGGRLDHLRAEADASIANTDLYYAYSGTRTTSARHTLPGGKLRLSWDPPNGFALAATLGHTARVGEANELFLALRRKGRDWVGHPELEPARTTGADVTASWEGGGVRLTGSLFLSRVANFIDVVSRERQGAGPGPADARSWANVDATLRGAEATVVVPLATRLFLSGDVAYVRGTKAWVPEVGVTDGDLAEIPPLRGRLTARYDDGRLFGVIEGIFSGRQDHVDSSLDEEPTAGWATANLSAGYRRGKVSFTLGVSNLLDRYYTEHLSYQRDPFRSGVRVAAPGRAVFLNVSARF